MVDLLGYILDGIPGDISPGPLIETTTITRGDGGPCGRQGGRAALGGRAGGRSVGAWAVGGTGKRTRGRTGERTGVRMHGRAGSADERADGCTGGRAGGPSGFMGGMVERAADWQAAGRTGKRTGRHDGQADGRAWADERANGCEGVWTGKRGAGGRTGRWVAESAGGHPDGRKSGANRRGGQSEQTGRWAGGAAERAGGQVRRPRSGAPLACSVRCSTYPLAPDHVQCIPL